MHSATHRRCALPALALAGSLLGLSLGLASCSTGSASTPPVPGTFSAERAWTMLEEIVAFGPRPSGTMQNAALRDYLVGKLEGAGLDPVRETFKVADTPIGEVEFENILVDIPGEDPASGPIVILCAHFDTKRFKSKSDVFVGANDGGAGTAVLLELARILGDSRGDRPVNYRILFLDGEESINWEWKDPDNRYGSRHHVATLEADPETMERVGACVLLDLVGDSELQLFREQFSDRGLLTDFFDAAEDIGLGRHVNGPSRKINDDHEIFLDAGIPSVDLIDFHYGPRHSYWHSTEDTLDKCSQESLGIIGRIVLAGLPRVEKRVLAAAADD